MAFMLNWCRETLRPSINRLGRRQAGRQQRYLFRSERTPSLNLDEAALSAPPPFLLRLIMTTEM